MQTILIVEDDSTIHMMMHEYLERHGFRCEDAYSGTEALLLVQRTCPDLILMDLMLPGADGSKVLHEIRKAHDVSVIVVSAKGSVQHKVDLLKAGADDYMTKPFALEELEARIRAQLRRRGQRCADTTLRCGALTLLDDQRTLMIEDRRITLTRHEYRIMELLMQYPGRAFSKREIYEYAWEDVFAADDKTVAVHISNIRGKCGKKDLIETVWGIGFRLNQEGM